MSRVLALAAFAFFAVAAFAQTYPIKADYEKWGRVVKEANIKAE